MEAGEGEPFFLSLLEIPPPSCGAHIKGEGEGEEGGLVEIRTQIYV